MSVDKYVIEKNIDERNKIEKSSENVWFDFSILFLILDISLEAYAPIPRLANVMKYWTNDVAKLTFPNASGPRILVMYGIVISGYKTLTIWTDMLKK